MPCADHASVAYQQSLVDLVHYVRLADRRDLVQSEHSAIPSESDLFAAVEHVQDAYPGVIADRQTLHAGEVIGVTDPHIVVDRALGGVDDRESDLHALSD